MMLKKCEFHMNDKSRSHKCRSTYFFHSSTFFLRVVRSALLN